MTQRKGWSRDFDQHSIDTKTNPVLGFIGLEVNVRCASADGIEQDLVDEFNDGGIVTILGGFVELDLISISVLDDVERTDGIALRSF